MEGVSEQKEVTKYQGTSADQQKRKIDDSDVRDRSAKDVQFYQRHFGLADRWRDCALGSCHELHQRTPPKRPTKETYHGKPHGT